MPSRQTLLTPEEQWNRTVLYASSLYNVFAEHPSPPLPDLWVVRTPHRLLCLGDVLLVTGINGMGERYRMTGISSKGARLRDYYIPLSYGDIVQLPGDLINAAWYDPAIGRFVADLRASRRRRVGAGIPAPHPTPLSDRNAQGLRFDGCYRSRRKPRHWHDYGPKRDSRHYLRFFRDGTVISEIFRDAYIPGGFISPMLREIFVSGPQYLSEKFMLSGESISFPFDRKVAWRYHGRIDGAYLRLSKHCSQGEGSCDNIVYKFCPWEE
jgi:hypothetical protein